MKKLCAVLLLAGATAFAAEECREGHFRWDLGAQAGVAGTVARVRTNTNGSTTINNDLDLAASSFRGGAYLGAGYEFANKWMLALQASVDGDTAKANTAPIAGAAGTQYQVESPLHYAVDVRAGRHIHGCLFYALVGFEGTHIKYSLMNNTGAAAASNSIPATGFLTLTKLDSFNLAGVRGGLGMECELSEHWMMRLEGRYLWSKDKTVNVPLTSPAYQHKLNFNQVVAQLSIGYKF